MNEQQNNPMEPKNSYSQYGEDITIWNFLNRVTNGFYIDVGCNHPIINNNTYLLYTKGWRGINIDPQAEFTKLYEEMRNEDLFIPHAIKKEGGEISFFKFGKYDVRSTTDKESSRIISEKFRITPLEFKIEARNINSLIAETKYKELPVDFLNISVKGAELEIINSFDFIIYKPRIIACEVENIKTLRKMNVEEIMQSVAYNKLTSKNYILENVIGQTLIMRRWDVDLNY